MATQANTGMEVHLGGILEAVAKEKGIDKKILVETIEAAILKAAQSVFGPTRELEARFNDDSGQVDLFLYMTVVEEVTTPEREIALAEVEKRGLDGALGDDLGFQIFWHPHDAGKAKQQDQDFGDLLQIKQARSQFGRIAAQTAKQVLLSRVRDAERDIIFNEYKDRQGELIKGIVRRFEKGNNIIVDLGKTEGILPAKEQTPRETYRPGDRIVALVKIIDREARGPQVILSRQDGRLVEKLFEAEVPEIYEGIVKVVGIAREPGARSKIAVTSRDSDVDPVGACVGMKGSRVQAVVQELRGEKIDIVPWDKDPAKYVIAAVQPAEVHKVIVDDADHRMELVVPDEKLSLAIGRKGQNVRLAAQLSGWRLDIISESRFKQLEDESLRALQGMEGVDEGVARAMYRAGFRTPEEIADATVEELAAIAGLSEASVGQRTKEAAEAALEARRQELLAAAKTKPEALTERERLSLLRGVGERTVESLVEGGFHSPESIVREDETRLAQRSGLSQRKAASVRAAAVQFLEGDWKAIEAARSDARRAAASATANPLGIITLNEVSSTPTPSRAAHAQPRRTCVGCGQRDDARAMVALFVEGTSVPGPGGIRVELAPPRSRPQGRGAHLHPRKACVATAAKRGLSRAFRRELRVPEATLAAAVSVGASRRAMDVLSRASRGGAVAPLGDEDRGAFLVVARDAGDVTQRPAVARAIASGRAVAMSTRAGLATCFRASRASAARTGAGAADVAALWVSGARAAEAIASACAIESTFGVVSALEDG